MTNSFEDVILNILYQVDWLVLNASYSHGIKIPKVIGSKSLNSLAARSVALLKSDPSAKQKGKNRSNVEMNMG